MGLQFKCFVHPSIPFGCIKRSMNAHTRGWFLATSSINLAGSGVLMLRYGAYGLLMKMHLWLIEKRTQSTHQYLAFDCAIILSSTCFIIWISGYCVLHCIWIALKFFLMFVWIMDIVIDPYKWPIMSSFSWSFYVVFQMLYGPFISSISFAHLLRIKFLLVRSGWPCLIEWDLC